MISILNQLCSIQGRLFELSVKKGYESLSFIKTYMNSDEARLFNSSYDRSQWMGEEYLLDELVENYEIKKGKSFSLDAMFWIGYIYTYWAYKYKESCKKIYKIADAKTMFENYAGLHTVSMDLAIQDLIEQYELNKKNKSKQ